VAANLGMRRAFGEVFGQQLVVPDDFFYMGAIGAALFALRAKPEYGETTFTRSILEGDFSIETFICDECEQLCSVVKYLRNGEVLGHRGDSCGKFSLGTGDAEQT